MKLAVFTKNWIGDAIFSEPLIRLLKKAHPEAHLIVITTPRCKEVFDANPFVDEIIFFDEKGEERSFSKRMAFAKKLKALKLDEVYILHRSFSRAFMCWWANIKKRVGYLAKKRGMLLTDVVYPKTSGDLHDSSYFTHLLNEEVNEWESFYRFYYKEHDLELMSSLLTKNNIRPKQFVVINPGANWIPKRWGVEKFAELANRIHSKYGMNIIATGHSSDKVLADEMIEQSKGEFIQSFCGRTTLRELGALYSMAFCVISSDSGPMHIASGVGTPVISIFGPTDETKTGPYGIGQKITLTKRQPDCKKPCHAESCACLARVTIEDVMDEFERLVQK